MNHLPDYVDHWSERYPVKELYTVRDLEGRVVARHTFESFSHRTRLIAARLVDVGVHRGDRILLAYPTGLEILAAFIGVARAGALAVPIPPPGPRTASRPAVIAADCGAAFGLTTQSIAERLARADERGDGSQAAVRWLTSDEWRGESCGPASPRHHADGLFIQYTSGSTSRPKGVLVSHANVIHNGRATLDHCPTGVSWLPQFHDMGLIGYGLFPLVMGGSAHFLAANDFLRRPALWFEAISATRATCTSSPNFGLEYCLRADRLPDDALFGLDLSTLRFLMNASEFVRPSTQRRFAERFAPYGLRPSALVASYGLAENTLAVTHGGRRVRHRSSDGIEVASCGAPIAGVTLAILDRDTDASLPDGEVGEVVVSGPSVTSGYWRSCSQSAKAFDGVVRTGDLGFLDGGELFVCGRAKNMVSVRGRNVYAEDIEHFVETALAHVRAGQVAALCGEDDESVLLLIELSGRSERPDLRRIARACLLRLGVLPARVVLVRPGVITRTTSGKLARVESRLRLLAVEGDVLASYAPDAADAEKVTGLSGVLSAIAGLSDRRAPGASDATLADLGVDSLTMVEIALLVDGLLEERRIRPRLDGQTLSALTPGELIPLVDLALLGRAEDLCARLDALARNAFERDMHLMAADARLAPIPVVGRTPQRAGSGVPRSIVMTGPTGSLGPFLVERLLAHTDAHIDVIVRAPTESAAEQRVVQALHAAGVWSAVLNRDLSRVRVHLGDMRAERWGLPGRTWAALARDADAILHNAAEVNYVATYGALRAANVGGARTALQLAAEIKPKSFHYLSSTVVYGWNCSPSVTEDEHNEPLADLTFGYAQSKCVAEHVVHLARQCGLAAYIYRPSFVTPSPRGRANAGDIVVRLLAFMINHGLGLRAPNQVSFVPADTVANNIVALMVQGGAPGVFNITADEYYTLEDVTEIVTRDFGYRFTYRGIRPFLTTMKAIARREDPVYPLLDFFESSRERFVAMEHKRYCNRRYRAARAESSLCVAEPTLRQIVAWLVSAMAREKLITPNQEPLLNREELQHPV